MPKCRGRSTASKEFKTIKSITDIYREIVNEGDVEDIKFLSEWAVEQSAAEFGSKATVMVKETTVESGT